MIRVSKIHLRKVTSKLVALLLMGLYIISCVQINEENREEIRIRFFKKTYYEHDSIENETLYSIKMSHTHNNRIRIDTYYFLPSGKYNGKDVFLYRVHEDTLFRCNGLKDSVGEPYLVKRQNDTIYAKGIFYDSITTYEGSECCISDKNQHIVLYKYKENPLCIDCVSEYLYYDSNFMLYKSEYICGYDLPYVECVTDSVPSYIRCFADSLNVESLFCGDL